MNPLVNLSDFEEKSKGIGADLAGTAGGRDALAARRARLSGRLRVLIGGGSRA